MKGLAFLKNVYNELLIIACYFVPEIDDVESLTFYTILYFYSFAAYKVSFHYFLSLHQAINS